MKELLIELADALDETRSGNDRRRAKLAEEARALARGPLAICAVGSSGSGKTIALQYIADHLKAAGCPVEEAGGHDRERVVIPDRVAAKRAFLSGKA